MAPIIPRVPDIKWDESFNRHWLNGNASRTHTFNALSFLFPQAERFFIEVAREVAGAFVASLNPKLRSEVNAFIAQEATHTSQHQQYNAILESMGFKNVVSPLVQSLQEQSYQHFSPLTRLAIVCGYEHYTAILGNFILSNPQILALAEKKMALVWGWHSAEETEHKAVCFDLYQAAGGGWLRRVITFMLVTLNFNLMFFRLYIHMLAHDGCLKPRRLVRTVIESARFFLGRKGVGWDLMRYGFRYLTLSFHPWEEDNRKKLARWLAENGENLRPLNATA
jgi:predicted metal-dependent hydrolase